MREPSIFGRFLLLATTFAVFFLVSSPEVIAQSQAINAQIEGTVTDPNGASVPNATVLVRNIETGAERTVTTDSGGRFRVPLLPLGTYRVTVESQGFRRLVRDGIILTTGAVATVNVSLETGGLEETVTITSDAPIADPGKIDVGRVMNTREVQNLPNVSRNPYNFALLQANVTGRPNVEFGVPRINANGYTRRTNYQLDGNNNTQADRGGIRLMPISDTFVSEVQLVTNGFSAEFGNTPGLIMNAVTPSGTNRLSGSASYRFRRTGMSSRPFNILPSAVKPETKVDNITGAIGGPFIRDRWHFYTGYEWVNRDLAGEPQRTITISEANRQALIAAGVPASAFPTAIPAAQKVNFFIFRTDAQLNDSNRLSGRFNFFKNESPNNIAGGLNTLQRSITFDDKSYSVGLQLASIFSPTVLNELRFQYAKRDSRNIPNENSASGISVVITGVANIGAPENANTIAPLQETTQFQNNLTWTRGNHVMKFGGGMNRIDDVRRSGQFARYTFPNLTAYLNALNGSAPFGYTNYLEAFGDPNISYYSTFINLFAQDDWRATSKLKINYGIRYDLYIIPEARADSPFSASQNFKVDKNNIAPRLGMVYSVRDGRLPTVFRASAGIYFDTVYLDFYQRALINNGSPSFFNFSFGPATPGAPAFPNTLGSLPPGTSLPVQSIETISPDFENMYAMHYNAQLEQAIADDLSFTVGFIHSGGRHIPVYRNINRINPTSFLADGRPIFSNTIDATTRLDPRFNNILMAESVANSSYTAMTLQLNKRFSRGYQFSANYTLSKAEDDAPEQNMVATQAANLVVGDPTNRRRGRGPALADQRHTFVMTFVGRPQFNFESRALRYLVNNNQIGIITTLNSGERFDIVAANDINLDGFIGSDNPVGIGRNSGTTPKQTNVDLRYSRFIDFTERYKLEVFGEFLNVFNINSVFQINNRTVTTDALGNVTGPLPTVNNRPVASLDSRQFQLGFKFIF
ncbi:MAG TPA: carboxypeptidase regulatory-like domain-containing protein [Pyrinomonadaceae bacterium]|nr:carboxypeptidase regulatory-like domain-containing protein [Pyrinomonadaceae bacterium]HMP66878.1 carboxypeptidase regulatory-like domain-containing protein [Pyrinomonadaceae bacterium]